MTTEEEVRVIHQERLNLPLWTLKIEEGALRQGKQAAAAAGKGKEAHSPLESLEERQTY